MWLLLPVAFLLLTLLALGTSNLQRGFRSNWLLSLGGTTLAWLSLLVLRFRLPQSLELTAWWAGAGLEFSASFLLDEFSWTLAFVVVSLLLAALLGQVRKAMSAGWATWVPVLAVGAAAVLSCFSADWLTFAYTFTLLDFLALAFLVPALKQESRHQAVHVLTVNLVASLILIAAWALSFYGAELRNLLVVLALTLRLGIWMPSPRLELALGLSRDQQTTLLLAPLAPSLALLTGLEPLSSLWGTLLFVPLLLLAMHYATRWFARGDMGYWQLSLAGLALASGLAGAPLAALAFALLLLLGGAILRLVQRAKQYRLPAAVVAVLLMAGLPFTASKWIASLGSGPIWQALLVLLGLSILLAGWLRQALRPAEQPLPPEPWMRSVRWIGLANAPAIWLLLGFGLLPYFGESLTLAWWPPLIVVASGVALFTGAGRLGNIKNTPLSRVVNAMASFRWEPVKTVLSQSANAPLELLSGLLEGRAGILWAMLFMALLLSLVAQFGVGG